MKVYQKLQIVKFFILLIYTFGKTNCFANKFDTLLSSLYIYKRQPSRDGNKVKYSCKLFDPHFFKLILYSKSLKAVNGFSVTTLP